MNASGFWGWLAEFRLTHRIKQEMLGLFHSAKRIAIAILKFLAEHRHFCHSLIVGACVAVIISRIPVLGPLLSGLSFLVCAAIGLVNELNDQLARTFSEFNV